MFSITYICTICKEAFILIHWYIFGRLNGKDELTGLNSIGLVKRSSIDNDHSMYLFLNRNI